MDAVVVGLVLIVAGSGVAVEVVRRRRRRRAAAAEAERRLLRAIAGAAQRDARTGAPRGSDRRAWRRS